MEVEEVKGEVEPLEMLWQREREIYIYVDELLNHATHRYQTTFTYLPYTSVTLTSTSPISTIILTS